MQPLWDDQAFLKRVELFAEMRGLSVRDAITNAGLAADYCDQRSPGRGRNIESILRLAKAINIHPGYLIFPARALTTISSPATALYDC